MADRYWVDTEARTADVCTGGTAIESGHVGGQVPANAFDDDTGTYWQQNDIVIGTDYIGYDLGVAVTKHVRSFRIWQHTSDSYQMDSIKLEWSDNGSSWTTVDTVDTSGDPGSGAWSRWYALPSSGAHRYWRLLANMNPPTFNDWIVYEIEMAEFSGNGDWNDTTNWSASSGGAGSAGVPGASDKAIFDANGLSDCQMDVAVSITEIDMQVGYTGTLDGATDDLNHAISGDCTMDGTRVDMGNGTWTVGGNFDNEDVGTFNRDASTLKMTGAAKTINVGTTNDLQNITIDGGSYTTTASMRPRGVLTIINTASLTIAVGDLVRVIGGSVVVSATGTNSITGAGTLRLETAAPITTQGGTIDVAILTFQGDHDANIVPGTYASAVVNIENNGAIRTFKFAAGTYNFTGATGLAIDAPTASAFTVDGATNNPTINITGDCTMDETGGGALTVSMGNGTWTVGGNFDNKDVTTFNRNNSTVKMTGTTKTLTSSGTNDLHKLELDGATVTAATTFDIQNLLLLINTSVLTSANNINIRNGDVQVSATGTNKITGAGTLSIKDGVSISVKGGVIDIARLDIFDAHDANIVAGTYESATVCIRNTDANPKTFKFAAGTYTFTGNPVFETTGAGAFTVDGATNNPTINVTGDLGSSDGGGNITLNMGNGTWTCSGDFDISAVTTFNRDAGTIVLSGAAKNLVLQTTTTFYKLTISGTITQTAGDFIMRNVLSLTGTLTINTTLSGELYGGQGSISIGTSGILAGAGTFYCFDNTPLAVTGSWRITIAAFYWARGHSGANGLPSGTYESADFYITNATSGVFAELHQFQAGTFTFTGDVHFDQFGAGGANLTIQNTTNNPSFIFEGNVTCSEGGSTLTWQAGTGTITLSGAGAGTQTINFLAKSVEDIIVDDTGAVKQLTGGVTTELFTGTNGTIDVNGQTVVSSGNWTMGAGIDFSDLVGSDITFSGSPTWDGRDLNASGAWVLTVASGTLTVSNSTVANSDASGSANKIDASDGTNTDNGSNTFWNFGAAARSWIM